MTPSPRRTLLRSLSFLPPVAALVLMAPQGIAFAQAAPSSEQIRDAGKHFQRGVALYNEADYAGALAEFRRAYEIAPNAAVLYNIGQTQFQLRSYAAALGSFERYVSEAGSNADHRTEAQTAIETLRSRVGKIDVTAPDGAEIVIDDESAGKTPLPPVLAAVGKRKLVATKDGRSSSPRYVEVAAGETVKAELRIEEGAAQVATPSTSTTTTAPTTTKPNYTPAIALWTATGVLAAGSVVFGALALSKNSDLESARTAYDPSTGVAQRRANIDDAGTPKTLALVTDILIPLSVIAGGAAIYFTLVPPKKASTSSATVRMKLAPGGAGLAGTF